MTIESVRGGVLLRDGGPVHFAVDVSDGSTGQAEERRQHRSDARAALSSSPGKVRVIHHAPFVP